MDPLFPQQGSRTLIAVLAVTIEAASQAADGSPASAIATSDLS
jgi:hypothetical protein